MTDLSEVLAEFFTSALRRSYNSTHFFLSLLMCQIALVCMPLHVHFVPLQISHKKSNSNAAYVLHQSISLSAGVGGFYPC